MKRREFLVGSAAGAAAIAGIVTAGAQGQPPAAGQAPQGGGQRQGAAPGRGRGLGPAQVPAAKLARIAIMSLDHGSILKLPWNATPSENQTLALIDLPQYYIDTYGVHNVEFQHTHLVNGTKTAPDPAFFRELRAKFDQVGSKANQINIEIGVITNLTPDARAEWLALAKKWVDAAPILGVTRLMLNQTGLDDENKAGVISIWKEIQDYARPKGIKISAETRGNGVPTGGLRGREAGAGGAAAAPAPPPPISSAARLRLVWGVLEECIEAAGGYSNLDWGGAGRFLNQQELHDAIKGMLKSNSGQMHIKSSPDWDIGTAVRYSESIGYKGLYTIEVNPDPAVRIVYNTILANLT
jgi:hypothetical protein